MELTKQQRKMLKSIKKSKFSKENLTSDDMEIYNSLHKNGYISVKSIYESEDSRRIIYSTYRISQKGELAIERDQKEIFMWLIPVIFSIVSIVLSIISIYYTSLPENIQITNIITATIQDTNATILI